MARDVVPSRRLIAAGVAWAAALTLGCCRPSAAEDRPFPPLPEQLQQSLPVGWQVEPSDLVAYEDNSLFTYAVVHRTAGSDAGGDRREWTRRFVLLKPDKVIWDDMVTRTGDKDSPDWTVSTSPQTPNESVRLTVRFEPSERCIVAAGAERTIRLRLPALGTGSPEVAVESANDEHSSLPRPLADGILPFGPDGMALVERWDSAYRQPQMPAWDLGRASSHLVRAISDGTLPVGRVAVLGCGTGSDAVYLAGKGFKAVGIDVAPTALGLAKKKADDAGVRLEWLLADVLRLPVLEPFDVVYDRGCYHGLRRTDGARYVEMLRQITRPGALILIEAGNANEERHYGPPRVKEEEVRADFADGFEIVSLRETHFDTRDADTSGALSWTVLLRRK